MMIYMRVLTSKRAFKYLTPRKKEGSVCGGGGGGGGASV